MLPPPRPQPALLFGEYCVASGARWAAAHCELALGLAAAELPSSCCRGRASPVARLLVRALPAAEEGPAAGAAAVAAGAAVAALGICMLDAIELLLLLTALGPAEVIAAAWAAEATPLL